MKGDKMNCRTSHKKKVPKLKVLTTRTINDMNDTIQTNEENWD